MIPREAHFENKFDPDRFLKFFAIFDRHDEGARPSDHAIVSPLLEKADGVAVFRGRQCR
jgi:hypothetical protein